MEKVMENIFPLQQFFSNHGGQFNSHSSHLRGVNFKIFSNHGGQFKGNSTHLSSINFKIFSNHDGQAILDI